MPRTRVGGVDLNVHRIGVDPGAGPTVVMIHGLSADNLSSLYYTLAPPVSRFADVVLYDLRGHGRSELAATGYGLDDSVADLDALLDVFDVEGPVHLVGHSYGGAVALSFAVACPRRVASIVLVEGHAALEGWAAYQAASIAFLAFGLEKPEVVRWLDEEAGRKARKAFLDVKALIHETSLVDDIEHRTTTLTEADVRSVQAPVLAVYGEHTDIGDTADALTAWLPNVERHELDGRDHTVLLPCADEIAALVGPWLRTQAERRGELPADPADLTPAEAVG